MPLDMDAVNKSLRTVIRTLLQMPEGSVRKANKDAPTGDLSLAFATVLTNELHSEGVDGNSYEDNNVEGQLLENTFGTRRIVASVQFFRGAAYSSASRLEALFRTSNGNSLLRQNGLSFIRAGSVLDLSQVVDTYWEARAQVELQFYIPSVEQATVGTFSSIPITIKTEKLSNSTEVKLDS
jgi:hypothetical protein